MLRVLHVIGPMNVGGAQTQLLGLVRAGHGSRWEATVCATSPGPMLADFEATGVDVFALDRTKNAIGRARQIRTIVSAGSFDVIHSNLWHPNVYARLSVVGRRGRPQVVISERNVEMVRPLKQRLLDRALARWTDAYIGNSEAVCDFIAAVHPVTRAKVLHIANAVDKEIFRPSTFEMHSTVVKIGAIGRLFPEKGFDVLIEAARVLLSARSFTLEIAGDGPLKRELEMRAAGLPITFVGELERGAAVADFLRSLDAFVLPATHREGRPNVLLEALSAGVPTVATDIPGTREAVGDGAEIARPSDPVALARAIGRALDNPNARARALEQAEAIPDFGVLAASYGELFEAVCGRQG